MAGLNCLVTGATSGLGQCLIPMLLKSGFSVTATGRNEAIGLTINEQGARFVNANLITDDLEILTKNQDIIFHLAALSSPFGPSASFVKANLTITDRLIKASELSGSVKRFIFVSTPSIYTDSFHRPNITEADLPAKKLPNHYAATKLLGETLVRNAFFCANSKISGVIVRPKAIISRYDRVILPRLRQSLTRPFTPLPGGGRAKMSITHGNDVASALIATAHSENAAGEDFNISGDQALSLRELMTYVAQKLNLKPRFIDLPMGLAHLVGNGLEMIGEIYGHEPLLTSYIVKTFGYDQTFDLSKAKTLLNWQPSFGSIEAIDEALCLT
jgi:2-alkyl-3-oxoalkanoate reductase